MVFRQEPLDLDEVNRVVQNIAPVLANEPRNLSVAACLSIVVMAIYPHLKEDALISAVENASQLIATLAAASERVS
jgi:hypothetical protein